MLYHWLWNERPKQLADYQRRLEEAQDPAAAWAAAFPEFDPATPGALEKLDDTLDQHRRRGDLTFYKVEAHADASFTEAAVPPAEVHMLMLATRVRWNENDPFYFGGPLIDSQQSFTSNEAAEALREDPANPVATYLAHGNGHKPSPDAMRKTTAAHPSDWRAFYLLARTLERDDQWPAKETALREAVRLNPDSAAANNQLAWSLVTHGQAKEALPFANRATELAPGTPRSSTRWPRSRSGSCLSQGDRAPETRGRTPPRARRQLHSRAPAGLRATLRTGARSRGGDAQMSSVIGRSHGFGPASAVR